MRAVLAPVLFTLAVAGCAADAPTAPYSDAFAVHTARATQAAAPQRPIRGRCEATTIHSQPVAPGVVQRVSVGTCQISHLGRTQLLSVANTNLVTGQQNAEHTYTAANGDLLYATSSGVGILTPPSTMHFSGVTTISGGTGRFAGATGVMQAVGVSNLVAGTTTLAYDGWVSY